MAAREFTDREVSGAPSTPRVEKRYHDLLNEEAYIDSERACLYTEYMKEHWNEPLYIRAGGALKHVLSNLTPKIWDDELIVGVAVALLSGHAGLSGVRDVDARGLQGHQARGGGLHGRHLQRRKATAWASTGIHPEDSAKILEVATFGRARTGAARPRPC